MVSRIAMRELRISGRSGHAIEPIAAHTSDIAEPRKDA